jgi:CYTH domain-containing protein
VVREEKQVPINESAFTLLTAGFTEGQLVQKWRFYYQLNGFMLEFDLFEGQLQGLVTLEVEFKSVEEASAFSLPAWIVGAVEVTGNSQYANKNLALHGLP